MDKHPFVFNDQTKRNSYGFYILTAGISLERFKDNPMMLDQHFNHTSAVIGRWEDWEVDGALLKGNPVFDTGIEKGAEVSGQVERGFIKSCSMGITFNHEDFLMNEGELVLTKCELYEVSIVAVPSNANSIRLYADDGKLLTEDQIKQLCLSVQVLDPNKIINPKPDTMSKMTLSAVALKQLGIDSKVIEHDATAIEAAIAKLSLENADNKAKILKLENEQETALEQSVKDYVTSARLAGKISAKKEADYVELGLLNFDLLKSTIGDIPTKVTLADKQVVPAGTGEVKTVDDFEKLDRDAKLAFKTSDPEAYKNLFKTKK